MTRDLGREMDAKGVDCLSFSTVEASAVSVSPALEEDKEGRTYWARFESSLLCAALPLGTCMIFIAGAVQH